MKTAWISGEGDITEKLIIAHRGAPSDAKENTMGSFEKAMTLGADMIEFDVTRTKDNVLIAYHTEMIFQEAFRVLKPGGRLMISDIVLLKELPKSIKESIEAYIGCVSGAIMKDEYLQKIQATGFQDVRLVDETLFPVELMADDPAAKRIIDSLGMTPDETERIANSVASIKVSGIKPAKR